MYEIWETAEPAVRLGEAGTFTAAMERLDEECRRRHRQAAANGEGSRGMRYRFEVLDGAGRTAAMLTWGPDTDRPYQSLAAASRAAEEAV